MKFALSSAAHIETRRHGAEAEPVIVIDDAAEDPDALLEDAAARAFGPLGPYYPGVRSALDEEFRESARHAIASLLTAELGVTAPDWSTECYYSLATTPPERLTPIQRFPHYDGVEDERFAALLFLCGPEFGGTAFYRHLTTGFESVNASRFPRFKEALEADVRGKGLPPAAYIGDGEPFFRKTAEFEAAPNRMLIYRGKALHCSAIKTPELLSSDPRRGRLTVNFFLSPRSVAQ